MPIPPEFEREALYDPSHWFIHDVQQIDVEGHRVVGVIDTTRVGSLCEAQRPWPGHPKHLPGAVAIQVTGTLGNLYAVCVLGLRASDGWVGYGTHVKNARFHKLGAIGPPVIATAEAVKRRRMLGTWFLEFAFTFDQEGERVYESQQTAAWRRQES
ncbi:MAG: hypothetical protein ABMB14_20255 [Myxococcota bacterium]